MQTACHEQDSSPTVEIVRKMMTHSSLDACDAKPSRPFHPVESIAAKSFAHLHRTLCSPERSKDLFSNPALTPKFRQTIVLRVPPQVRSTLTFTTFKLSATFHVSSGAWALNHQRRFVASRRRRTSKCEARNFPSG